MRHGGVGSRVKLQGLKRGQQGVYSTVTGTYDIDSCLQFVTQPAERFDNWL